MPRMGCSKAWVVGVLVSVGCGSNGAPESTGVGGAAQGGAIAATSGGAIVGSGGVASRGGFGGLAGAGASGGGAGGSGAGGTASGGQSTGGAPGAGGLPACVARDDVAAPFVAFTWTSEEAQPPMGGVIESGTYFLTSLVYHGGTYEPGFCILSLRHEVLRIDATSATEGTLHSTEVVMYDDGSGRNEYKQGAAFTTEGTSLMGRYTCWEPYTYVQPYTASPGQLRFIRGPFDPTNCHHGVTLVLTYDKQP